MLKKFIFIYILVLVLASSTPCLATSSEEGLSISPPISDINLEPGKTYDEVIKVTNPTKEVVVVYPVARNFTSSGETGVPTIESPGEDATYGLASWISFNQTKLALTPEQQIEFKYKVTVPNDAEPGGHYGAVLFASEPPQTNEQATQIALASMIGSLILAKVPGDIVEKAEVKEFSVKQKIFLKPPVDFILRITNSGNIHIKPQGEIVITNWGKNLAALDINSKKGNILPKSTRKFDDLSFKGKSTSFGKFTAKLMGTYGENSQTLSGQITFWIIPWWLIIAVIVIILSIVVLIVYRFKKKPQKAKKVILR